MSEKKSWNIAVILAAPVNGYLFFNSSLIEKKVCLEKPEFTAWKDDAESPSWSTPLSKKVNEIRHVTG